MRLCFYLPMALFPNVYEGKTYLMFHDQKLRSWELSLWLCFPKSIRYRSPQRVFLSDPILQGTFFFPRREVQHDVHTGSHLVTIPASSSCDSCTLLGPEMVGEKNYRKIKLTV